MFNLHQEISTPIGLVIILSIALLAGTVMISQSMETMKETYSLENRMMLD
ncbi:hypothetical protein KAR26_01290 [Candidatus Parcubacteria bacterium]|nr:hypothetical protein [Candidatus Parcubacteria bacterium]